MVMVLISRWSWTWRTTVCFFVGIRLTMVAAHADTATVSVIATAISRARFITGPPSGLLRFVADARYLPRDLLERRCARFAATVVLQKRPHQRCLAHILGR